MESIEHTAPALAVGQDLGANSVLRASPDVEHASQAVQGLHITDKQPPAQAVSGNDANDAQRGADVIDRIFEGISDDEDDEWVEGADANASSSSSSSATLGDAERDEDSDEDSDSDMLSGDEVVLSQGGGCKRGAKADVAMDVDDGEGHNVIDRIFEGISDDEDDEWVEGADTDVWADASGKGKHEDVAGEGESHSESDSDSEGSESEDMASGDEAVLRLRGRA